MEFDINEAYENALLWKDEESLKDLISMGKNVPGITVGDLREKFSQWIRKNEPYLSKLLSAIKIPIVASFATAPHLAASIDMAFFVGGEILHTIEMDNIKIVLREYVDRQLDKKLDENDPAVQALVKHIMIKAARCSKEAQIKRIMDVLQAALEEDIPSYDEAEDFINILSELSENEAILLARVYRYFDISSNEQDLTEDKTSLFAGLPDNSGDYLLNRLEGKGLLNSEPTITSDEDFNQAMEGFCTIEPTEEENEDTRKDRPLILNSKTYLPNLFGKKLFQSIKK